MDPRPEDPRTRDDLVALVISVVYRQHAIPVAWHIAGAQEKGFWIDHFCRLLAPAGPVTAPVHVLWDQGLGRLDLWAQFVALGWHPCLRYQPHITFRLEGQTSRVPMRSLITGPGGPWVGTGQAFPTKPLDATLFVLHDYGQAQPCVQLTDTPVAQTEPTLYACRHWIEQGFGGLKTVGWKWHKTRRRDPTRGGRHWLVLAIATLLAMAYGTRREDAEVRHRAPAPGAPRRHLNLPASHSCLALSRPRSPRPFAPRGPPQRQFRPTGPFCPHTAADSRPRPA